MGTHYIPSISITLTLSVLIFTQNIQHSLCKTLAKDINVLNCTISGPRCEGNSNGSNRCLVAYDNEAQADSEFILDDSETATIMRRSMLVPSPDPIAYNGLDGRVVPCGRGYRKPYGIKCPPAPSREPTEPCGHYKRGNPCP